MAQVVTQVTDHFSLAHFECVQDRFTPPIGDFDPNGSWVNSYDIWERSQGSGVIGAIRVARTPLGNGRARLEIQFRKRTARGAYVHRAEMSVECGTDVLATPVRWQAHTWAEDANGTPLEETRLRETGEVTNGTVRVRIGETEVRMEINGAFTLTWCLFDAVQRLNGAAMTPVRFTLIDRFHNEIKGGQRLGFRGAVTVDLGGKRVWREEKRELERGAIYRPVPGREDAVPTTLLAYDHTGRGIVPTVYWVAEQGRLLFLLSGLFGYVFNAEAQP